MYVKLFSGKIAILTRAPDNNDQLLDQDGPRIFKNMQYLMHLKHWFLTG